MRSSTPSCWCACGSTPLAALCCGHLPAHPQPTLLFATPLGPTRVPCTAPRAAQAWLVGLAYFLLTASAGGVTTLQLNPAADLSGRILHAVRLGWAVWDADGRALTGCALRRRPADGNSPARPPPSLRSCCPFLTRATRAGATRGCRFCFRLWEPCSPRSSCEGGRGTVLGGLLGSSGQGRRGGAGMGRGVQGMSAGSPRGS